MIVKAEILSLAFIEPLPGKDDDCVSLLRELAATLASKGYSRDVMYRDTKDARQIILLRYWAGEEARARAQEDPDVHRFWRQLALLCRVTKVYESLEPA